MKKLVFITLTLTLLISFLTSCTQAKDDWQYIEEKGELIVGITLFAPMNYNDENGNLTGFETEFATAVCEELDLVPIFQEIDWGAKETELTAKNIDTVWNGMTITEERAQNMDISIPYMENKQVMIIRAEDADKYKTPEDLAGANVVAEIKSAGETVAQSDEFFSQANYTSLDTQAKALLEVKAGTADIAVVDYVLSIGSLGEGTDYADLVVSESKDFSPEEYGIAFRKDSPETLEKVNEAIRALAENGTLNEIATKYNLQDLIIFE